MFGLSHHLSFTGFIALLVSNSMSILLSLFLSLSVSLFLSPSLSLSLPLSLTIYMHVCHDFAFGKEVCLWLIRPVWDRQALSQRLQLNVWSELDGIVQRIFLPCVLSLRAALRVILRKARTWLVVKCQVSWFSAREDYRCDRREIIFQAVLGPFLCCPFSGDDQRRPGRTIWFLILERCPALCSWDFSNLAYTHTHTHTHTHIYIYIYE